MHELRKDPLLGRWVAVISESRPPSEYKITAENTPESGCLLCPGREGETPPEITSIREYDRWLVRVIPHFRPVFQIEGDLGRRGVGMYDRMNNIGANEIVIETPEHERSPEDIGIEQV
ncbi:MAG: galactose-1-phosphate uridylyltransferase, partial [Thermodesulfovibrionales bacterium]